MNDVTVTKTFEEKMKDRIKSSIGDLISDDDLSKLVHKGIDEVFFKKRVVNPGSYNSIEGPSLIEEIIKELLEEKVRSEISVWINSNNGKVQELIGNVVTEGVGMSVVKAFNFSFQNELINFQNEVNNKLINRQF